MTSVHPILIIIKKEFIWLLANGRVLLSSVLTPFAFLYGLVIMPLEQTAGIKTFMMVIFSITYFGVLFTSSSIIREKERGTLLALLITPLRGMEWVLGIFFTSLIMSLSMCLVSACLSGIDLLFQPFIILNIALVAGTLCFLGIIIGLFSENQRESGQYSLPIYLLFCGTAFFSSSYISWLPDYHLAMLLTEGEGLSFWKNLYHTTFNLTFFLVSLKAASQYSLFYFSNNREKRYSHWISF